MAAPKSLPDTTPQAFATFVNQEFAGDNGKKGGTVAGLTSLGFTGSTLGDQWLSFYKHAVNADKKKGTSQPLLAYEQAWVVLWTDVTLGGDISQASAGGLKAVAAAATNVIPQAPWISFLGALGQANTWIRVAKVVIGGALLIVGAAKITGADKQVAVLGKAMAKAPLL